MIFHNIEKKEAISANVIFNLFNLTSVRISKEVLETDKYWLLNYRKPPFKRTVVDISLLNSDTTVEGDPLGYVSISSQSYKLRCSPTITDRILNVIDSKLIKQVRPGIDWFDYSYSTKEEYRYGVPNMYYYEISDIASIFDDCYIQRCKQLECFPYNHLLAAFTNNDVTSEHEVEHVRILKDEHEFNSWVREEYKSRIARSSSYMGSSTDWMDNPEDYWNID